MTKVAWSAMKVSGLYVPAVDLKPHSFDFSEGYGEKYEVLQPADSEPGDENWNEPMMNTWWPLPDGCNPSQEDVDRLASVPFATCIVYNNDEQEYGIALTGGGMDLSWDIAGTYVLLGYLPPVDIYLPRFAGMRLDAMRRVIAGAMERSYRVMVNWMQSNLNDLKATRAYMSPKKEA